MDVSAAVAQQQRGGRPAARVRGASTWCAAAVTSESRRTSRQIVAQDRRSAGTPVLLRDVAEVAIGPEIRRGIADLDGRGEAVGGIVVMRHGENARDVIAPRQGASEGDRAVAARRASAS